MKVEKRILATVAATGALTLALAGFVGLPTILSIQDIKRQFAEQQDRIDQGYALRRLTRNSMSMMVDVRQRFDRLGLVSVVEGEELQFVRSLENAADEAGVTQQIKLDTANQKDISPWEKEIPLDISLTGDYRNLLVYLHKIETLPYYILGRNLRISILRQQEKATEGMVEAQIDSVISWRSASHPIFQKQAAAPATDPVSGPDSGGSDSNRTATDAE